MTATIPATFLIGIVRELIAFFVHRDSWAKNISLNPNVKVYVGAPASAQAAGEGYVSAEELSEIAQALQRNYTSFGGVMLWDVSEAYGESSLLTICLDWPALGLLDMERLEQIRNEAKRGLDGDGGITPAMTIIY